MREESRHICSRVYGVACVVIRPPLQAHWRKQLSQVMQRGVRERKQDDTTCGHGMKVRSGMVGVGWKMCGKMSEPGTPFPNLAKLARSGTTPEFREPLEYHIAWTCPLRTPP